MIKRVHNVRDRLASIITFDYFLLIIIALSLVPNKLFISPRHATDSAWQITVNNAFTQHYRFGTDIIFTYGPLGFVSYGLPTGLGVLAISIIFYKFLIVFCLFNIGKKALLFQVSLFGKLMVVFAFLFCGKFYPFDPTMFILMIISLGCMYVLERPSLSKISILGVLAVFSLFIKINSGFVGFLFVLISMLFLLLRKKINLLQFSIVIGSLIALTMLVVVLLRVDILQYIKQGLTIVNYYNDAMVFPLTPTSVTPVSALALAVLLIVFFLISFKSVADKQKWGVSFFIGIAFFFILFKQGFVGAAFNHQLIFFSAIPFFFLGLARIGSPNLEKESLITITNLAIFFTVCAIFNIGYMPFHSRWLRDLYMKEPVTVMEMPPSIKAQIGNSTVDIFPSDIDRLYFAKLNFVTRPIPQGYSVYHYSLDSINASYYISRKAPEFVIFGIGSLADRHPFWDETNTKISLRNNYKVVDSFRFTNETLPPELSNFYLLKRESQTQPTKRFLYHYFGKLGNPIPVPHSNGPIIMKAYIQYSFLNRLKRFLFHPELLHCTLKYDDGSKSEHIAILPMMAGGVIVNKKILSNEAAYWLFDSGFQPANTKEITFLGSSTWFDQNVAIDFFEILPADVL